MYTDSLHFAGEETQSETVLPCPLKNIQSREELL